MNWYLNFREATSVLKKGIQIMPAMALPRITIASLSFTLMDTAGRLARTGISELTSAPSGGQITALSDAIGNISNAAVIAETGTAQSVDTKTGRIVFDEAYSGVTEKAVFIFENSARRKKKLEVPAPDASIFGTDGLTVDYANASVVALVSAYTAIATGYTLKRAFLSSRSRKAPTGNRPPTVSEPGTLELPPGLPAIEA